VFLLHKNGSHEKIRQGETLRGTEEVCTMGHDDGFLGVRSSPDS
jgi:hypothetical protein